MRRFLFAYSYWTLLFVIPAPFVVEYVPMAWTASFFNSVWVPMLALWLSVSIPALVTSTKLRIRFGIVAISSYILALVCLIGLALASFDLDTTADTPEDTPILYFAFTALSAVMYICTLHRLHTDKQPLNVLTLGCGKHEQAKALETPGFADEPPSTIVVTQHHNHRA